LHERLCAELAHRSQPGLARFPAPKLAYHSTAALSRRLEQLQQFVSDLVARARAAPAPLEALEGFLGLGPGYVRSSHSDSIFELTAEPSASLGTHLHTHAEQGDKGDVAAAEAAAAAVAEAAAPEAAAANAANANANAEAAEAEATKAEAASKAEAAAVEASAAEATAVERMALVDHSPKRSPSTPPDPTPPVPAPPAPTPSVTAPAVLSPSSDTAAESPSSDAWREEALSAVPMYAEQLLGAYWRRFAAAASAASAASSPAASTT